MTGRNLPLWQVDAFADRPFTGNPAAVCVLPGEAHPEAAWMQSVAREMNLSETAFLVRQGDAFALRWFTPGVEVALCGHATLGSAHALWEAGFLAQGEAARFDTQSGRLTCTRAGAERGGRIEMDFPARMAEAATPPAELLPALGLGEARFVGRNAYDYFVEVESEALVRGLKPDHTGLRKLPVRGVIVTAKADAGGFDFVSRFFAPGSGVDEDPVTGSAHCALAPYWSARLGRDELVGYQASARGGTVWTRVTGDRVVLGGHAVTVLRGELLGLG